MLKKLITCVALVLFTASASALDVERLAKGERIDYLEVVDFGALSVVNSEGRLLLTTQDGRFVFELAAAHDVWLAKTYTDAEEIVEAKTLIPLSQLNVQTANLNVGITGQGDEIVSVWVDPNCEYCERVRQASTHLEDQYTFHWYFIPVYEQSKNVVRAASCVTDARTLGAAYVSGELEDLATDTSCRSDRYDANLLLGDMIGIQGIPFLIQEGGQVYRGVPASLENWLEGK